MTEGSDQEPGGTPQSSMRPPANPFGPGPREFPPSPAAAEPPSYSPAQEPPRAWPGARNTPTRTRALLIAAVVLIIVALILVGIFA